MSTSHLSARRGTGRRAALLAALAALPAATTAWAPAAAVPAAGATAPAPAAEAVHAEAAAAPSPGGVGGTDAASVTLSPGDPIYSGGARCTVGFNVTDGEHVFILTAGHCTSVGSYWYADPEGTVPIGPTVLSSFPGDDFGLIRYEDPGMAQGGGYTAGSPSVGEYVYTVTPGTGIHSGYVTGLNTTVDYGGGNVVYGLIRTNICAERPLSGVPLIGGGRALGIGSAASGWCSTGGTTYFQPVAEALAAAGLTLL